MTTHAWVTQGDQTRPDAVVDECAVALQYNGISHAVMMATPRDLADFATGFSLSEGIVDNREQIYQIDIDRCDRGVTVAIEVAGAAFDRIKRRRRQMTGRSGCGLCGTESLAEAIRPIQKVSPVSVSADAIEVAISHLREHQVDGQATGASHVAAWAEADGRIVLAREDVGRHNALDKLIGAGAGAGAGFVLISSRASYEMVHKACAAGIGALVAVSAPTSLAIDIAADAGLTLIGFARPGRYQTYGTLLRSAQ